jgi:hypothetical protein
MNRASMKASAALLGALAAVAIAMSAGDARADRKQACVRAHESAQALRREGKLRASREEVLSCLSDDCPSVVRADCSRLLEQLESTIPTVVFEGKDKKGQPTTAVRVSVDGAAPVEQLDGRAQMIDPGVHHFHFESADGVRDVQVGVAEGQKNTLVLADFTAPRPPPPPAVAPHPAGPPRQRTTGFIVGGAGVAALGAGVVFGILALGAKGDATCSSPCPAGSTKLADAESAYSRTNTLAWVSDVTLAVGAVALLVGAYLVLDTPPTRRAAAITWEGPL